MATPDITDTGENSTTTGFNDDPTTFVANTANTSHSSPLAAVRIPGQFALNTVDNFNFLGDQLGEIRNLQLGLLETDRGTGEFVQLVHKAYLEVQCDFTKFINFNASSTTHDDDDAYQLTGFTLTNDPAVTENNPTALPPVRRLITDSEYRLDIRPALEVSEGAPLTVTDPGPPVRATYANQVLSSYWFPVGAVLIDLGSATGPAGPIPATNRSVTVGAASGSDNANYQVDIDKTLAGMTLFGQVIITCSNGTGTPMISAKATFDPTDSTDGEGPGAIILGGGGDSEITVTLLSQDDYTKAQKVVFTNTRSGDTDTLVEDNTGSNAIQLTNSVHPLQPGPNDADDFTITLTLTELGGSQNENTIGRSMISEIKTSVNANARLLQAFTITATQIDFSTASEFSGYLRSLAANATDEAARDPLMPILSGEKFIIQTPTTIDLAITPFQYAFDSRKGGGGAGPTAPVTQFKLLNAMEVYAVLKHTPQSETPVLKTDVTGLAAKQQEPLTSTFPY